MRHSSGPLGIALLLTAAIATGCADKPASDSGRQAAMAEQKQVPAARPPVPPAPRPQPPAAPRTETFVIPSGTNVVAVLETSLATDTNHSGDAFQARTINPIVVGGRTVVPAGAMIHGVLRNVEASGKISGRATMTLDFERINDTRGQSHAISAQPLTLRAASNTRGDVEKIAAGGVLGAIIGGVAGGKKGAVIGAGAGVGAGTVIMLATKGEDVELAAGHQMNVAMLTPTSIELLAQR